MEINHYLKIEAARQEIYRLIADFYLLPKSDHLDKVANLEDLLQLVCPGVAVYLQGMQHEINLQQLKIDHARLFVGPFKLLAPPFGSVYIEKKHELMGASTNDVRRRYKQLGLDLSKRYKEAPDHIATELEFMHFLIFKKLEAIAEDDFENAQTLVRTQLDFLEKHLGYWTPEFTALVEEHAKTSFFKSLAQITREFVQQERQYLAETSQRQIAELARELQ